MLKVNIDNTKYSKGNSFVIIITGNIKYYWLL